MAFELPKLAYAYDALEPHIDARTMEIHHTKHHQTYITNLNGAVDKTPELAGKSLVEMLSDLNAVPEGVRNVVRNHGGGTYNHNLFWEIMGPKAGGAPKGELAKAIDASFTSFDNFKAEFTKALLQPASAPVGLGSSRRAVASLLSPPPIRTARSLTV
jgi:Fe-Mn family superoxide dismutase